jgi:hypothetical protein
MRAALRLIDDLRFLRGEHGVATLPALADFFALRQRIRINRQDFLQFGLYDRGRPMADRLSYLSFPDRIRIEYLMNPREPSRRLLDKLAVDRLFALAGVATLDTVAAWVPAGADSAWSGRRICDQDGLAKVLGDFEGSGLVVKPNGGSRGVDVMVFDEVGPHGARQLDGTVWTIEALARRLGAPPRTAAKDGQDASWKIERRAQQHPMIEAAVGPTLATVRVVVFRPKAGAPQLLPPTWKVPIGRGGTDNLDQGSLMAAVDIATGSVGPVVQKGTRRTRLDHPETRVRIEGMVLPDWPALLELAVQATGCFPELRSLGCDLAMTTAGPRVVEINPFWGSQMLQIPRPRGLVEGAFAEFLAEIGAAWVLERRGGTAQRV